MFELIILRENGSQTEPRLQTQLELKRRRFWFLSFKC